MLKISQADSGGGRFILRLEGVVVGPWVAELRETCERRLKDGGRLVLDMAEVSFADEDGVALLASLSRRRVRLLQPTPFLQEQLKSAVVG
jgi:anti-anti-sigma regulatory factor